jgi:ABC-type transport system involved in multi-copper enzyme maturation permease subunit
VLGIWLPVIVVGVLCLLSTVWSLAVYRMASMRIRPWFKWMWISTAILMLILIVGAVLATIDQSG